MGHNAHLININNHEKCLTQVMLCFINQPQNDKHKLFFFA